MQIVEVKITDLKPCEMNPRAMTEKEAADLMESLSRFGMVEPIVCNSAPGRENIIIGGHQRFFACQKMGRETMPVVYVSIPDIAKEQELNLRLNKNTGHFEWDLLANFDASDLIDFGFTSEELDKGFNLGGKEDDFDAQKEYDEIKDAETKPGDLYHLGSHCLLCGDATNCDEVKKLMGGNLADMIFTDPPYAVNYGADQDILNKKSGNKSKLIARPIIGDNLTTEECAEQIWRPAFKNLYENAKDDCSFYMTMCQGGDQMMMMMMMSENWQIKHELIWVKNSPVFSMGRLDYDYQHEPILYGWKKKHNWYGNGKFLKSIWEIPKPSKSDLHPTMKPIELITNALLNSSKKDDIILDFFLGSGSTLIACEETNRICYGMEIDPYYCDVIIKRWELFTGQNAEKLS